MGSTTIMALGAPVAILGGIGIAMMPLAKTTFQTHTAKHFTANTFDKKESQFYAQINTQMYSNDTLISQKVIHEKLTNKSSFLQCAPVKFAQKGAYYLLSHMINKKKPLAEDKDEKNNNSKRVAVTYRTYNKC